MSEDAAEEGKGPIDRVKSDDIDGCVFTDAKRDEGLGELDGLLVILLICDGFPVISLGLIGQSSEVSVFLQGFLEHLNQSVRLFSTLT